jgi:branched-chain amino acid transport system permease protein
MFLQILANGFLSGCGYALVALGFALIYTTTRTFHFAHGAVYTLSAYLFYTLYNIWAWPLWIALLLTPVFAALSGILIDKIVYLPLVRRGSSPFIHLLSSLGLYIVIVNFIAMLYGNDTKVLSAGVQSSIHLGALVLTKFQLLTLLSFAVLFAGLVLVLRKTSLGRTIRAMRDDVDLVSALGIDPLKTRMMVFAIGSGLAAVSAILNGLDVGIDPNIGLTGVLTAAVAVIIGGIGILEGAAFGALLLGVLQGLAIWQVSSRWQDAVTFLVLLLFLLFRPQGAFGRRRRREEVAI